MNTLCKRLALFVAAVFISGPARAEITPGKERVILHTNAGDLVLAFYPQAAPQTVKQFLLLARLGVYNHTHFHVLIPGYLAQVANALDRTQPLSAEQKAAIHPLPLESLPELRHHRGMLTMAHDDGAPNTGETSFFISLSNNPHLDGSYTIFGSVEEGMNVIDELLHVPRDPQNRPLFQLEITHVDVLNSSAELARHERVPAHIIYTGQPSDEKVPLPAAVEVALGVALILLVALGTTVASRHWPELISARVSSALHTVNVLVAAFLLFFLLTPQMHGHPHAALALFGGILGVFKLMSGFENSNAR